MVIAVATVMPAANATAAALLDVPRRRWEHHGRVTGVPGPYFWFFLFPVLLHQISDQLDRHRIHLVNRLADGHKQGR